MKNTGLLTAVVVRALSREEAIEIYRILEYSRYSAGCAAGTCCTGARYTLSLENAKFMVDLLKKTTPFLAMLWSQNYSISALATAVVQVTCGILADWTSSSW